MRGPSLGFLVPLRWALGTHMSEGDCKRQQISGRIWGLEKLEYKRITLLLRLDKLVGGVDAGPTGRINA